MTWPDPTRISATFTIDVTDSKGDVGAQPVTLPVVPPPGAGVITFTSTPRESVLLGLEYVYQAVVTDTDDYTPIYSMPHTGDPTEMTINPTTGLAPGCPPAERTGSPWVNSKSSLTQSLKHVEIPVICFVRG